MSTLRLATHHSCDSDNATLRGASLRVWAASCTARAEGVIVRRSTTRARLWKQFSARRRSHRTARAPGRRFRRPPQSPATAPALPGFGEAIGQGVEGGAFADSNQRPVNCGARLSKNAFTPSRKSWLSMQPFWSAPSSRMAPARSNACARRSSRFVPATANGACVGHFRSKRAGFVEHMGIRNDSIRQPQLDAPSRGDRDHP